MVIYTEPVLVKFTDGEELLFKNVSSYGINENGSYYVEIDGIKALFNAAIIKYVGLLKHINK